MLNAYIDDDVNNYDDGNNDAIETSGLCHSFTFKMVVKLKSTILTTDGRRHSQTILSHFDDGSNL